MKLVDNLNLTGKLTIQKIDRHNQIDQEITAHNDITLSGRRLVAQLFSQKNTAQPIDSIRVGTGEKDFDPNDTNLFQPIPDHSIPIKTINPEDIQEYTDGDNQKKIILRLSGDLLQEDEKVNGQALTEACLYSSNSKVMYNRVQFPPISKTENFKLTLIWEITF